MKKRPITFDEQKSEYINIEKNELMDNDFKEDIIMNKMIIQLVMIGCIGMVLLFFVFQSFTIKRNIKDEQVASDIGFENYVGESFENQVAQKNNIIIQTPLK